MVIQPAISRARLPKGIFVLWYRRYTRPDNEQNVVWTSTMIKHRTSMVQFFMRVCMTHTVWAKIQNKSLYEAKRRKWFPRDFTPKRSNDACDTRDFTLWCSNDAWIKSSRLRASIKKLCSLSSLCHSIQCTLLLSIHIIFCSRPLNKNIFFFMFGRENTRWTYDYMCELLYSRLNISC